MDFCGKNVVFVGGFSEIGVETCKLLVRKGIVNLVVLDKLLDEKALKELNSIDPQCYCQFMAYDLTNSLNEVRQVMKQVMQKIRNIDVLINAADNCDENNIELMVKINLTGLINTTIAAFELMESSRGGKGGVIVNVSSVAALTPLSHLPAYSATKSGAVNYTRALAQLESSTGITMYAICPYVRTLQENNNIESVQKCVNMMVNAMEQRKNGAIWKCDDNKLEELDMQNMYNSSKEI